jgi:hypothetical protein
MEQERYLRCPFNIKELKEECIDYKKCEWGVNCKECKCCFFLIEQNYEHSVKEISNILNLSSSKINDEIKESFKTLQHKISKESIKELLEGFEEEKQNNEIFITYKKVTMRKQKPKVLIKNTE